MNKQTIDELLSAMISGGEGVSDLLFTVGKPPFIESHGSLSEFSMKTSPSVFSPEEIDQLADHIIDDDERLRRDLANSGSCDCSYALKDLARFRVNIFKQNGRHSIVIPRLPSEIP